MQKLNHFVSVQQITELSFLEELFSAAADFSRFARSGAARQNILAGKILASLFFEPSTRTRFSFEAAMLRLGGQIISAENAFDNSSAKKGETLEDAVRIVSGYADCIVLRHPEKGSAQRASQVASVPVINAGDGQGEHPTQALVDIYTIQKERGKVDGLCIAFVGDLLYGRTAHSLAQLFACYRSVHLMFVSPPQLKMPQEYKDHLQANKVSFEETQDFSDALKKADVVYMTRMQTERFSREGEYEELKSSYILDNGALQQLSNNALILHPLPRVDEIAPSVDLDPRAAYFRQAQNGLFLRMALLQYLLSS